MAARTSLTRPLFARLSGCVILALLAACSDTSSGVPRCIPGKVESCACDSGSGTQTCLADGTFGACACRADDDGLTPDDASDVSDATGDASDATTPSDIPVFVNDASDEVTATDHCDPCDYGSVQGRVCSPSQHVGVANALVTLSAIDCDGTPRTYTTRSDATGSYYFPAIPCGLHEVHVEAGAFARDYAVQVEGGQLNDISGAAQKVCFAGEAVPIAVFWGQWDEQEDLLTDLGFQFTYYNFEFEYFNDTPPQDIEAVQVLRDPVKLAAYKILFFDCGSAALSWVHRYPEIGRNLHDFVLAGGSMYASDLSWAYVEAAFPDAIDFYGSDDLPDAPQARDGPQQVQGQKDYAATVQDATLASYLGAGAFTTRYGAGPLIAVEAAGPNTEVQVKGIVDVDLPAAVCGDGICDPSEVLQCADCTSLIPADHVQHAGPMVLTHRPSSTSGRVVYTTFHNDEQADALMHKLLYYLVFQL